MRIAIVHIGPLGHGGIRRVIESWSRVLARAGHEVEAFVQRAERNAPLPPAPGVRIHEYASPAGGRLGTAFRAVAAAVGIVAERARSDAFDAAVVHECHAVVPLRRALPRTPILLTVHSPAVEEYYLNNWLYAKGLGRRLSYPPGHLYWLYAERAALRTATGVHTLSDYTRALLCRRHPGAEEQVRWHRIPGSYDELRFRLPEDRAALRRRLGFEDGLRQLLTIRRLVPRNGVDRIVEAARRLRGAHPELRFAIGGIGACQEELRAEVRRAGVEDIVRFLGFVPDDSLPAHYQAADAFLLPTRQLECFGLPVIEALACGCPPLVMPEGGPAEICAPFPGLVAEQNTTDGFCELVARWAAGASVPAPQALAARATRDYSEASQGPAILDLVEKLVAS
jgi:glycosyltransferase involved in cell wall biosynthesis